MNHKSTLYIDESGKSSLAEEENNPFIITGVVLDDIEINSVEGFFTYIKRKFNINPDLPFHSYHIYEHPTSKLSDNELLSLSRVLADFVSLIPIKVRILEIDKNEFKQALGVRSNEDFKGSSQRKEIPNFPYRVMATDLFAWFGKYLHKKNMQGQIIADSRRGADHHLLNTLNMCKNGNVPFTTNELTQYINEKVNAICFSEKNFLSGGLEITDLISYVSYFRVRRLLSQNENIGIDLIWKEISQKTNILKVDKAAIKRFFGIKKNEVHKYLKS